MSGRAHDQKRRGVGRAGGGFTVLELLVVFFIVMIMAGITAPAVLRGVRQSRMRSAASQVASGLRRARNLAIATGEIYCAHFHNPDPLFKEVHPRVDIYQLKESEIGGTPVWATLNDEGRTGGGVNLPGGTQMAFSQGFVAFLPDGSAWGPGMGVFAGLSVEATPEYADPSYNDSWTVTVRSLSGRIDTEKVAP